MYKWFSILSSEKLNIRLRVGTNCGRLRFANKQTLVNRHKGVLVTSYYTQIPFVCVVFNFPTEA